MKMLVYPNLLECWQVLQRLLEGRLMRTPSTDGRQPEALLSDLLKAKSVEEGLLAKAENSTRKAELIVEARHLSGNPDLPPEEAIAFLSKRGISGGAAR